MWGKIKIWNAPGSGFNSLPPPNARAHLHNVEVEEENEVEEQKDVDKDVVAQGEADKFQNSIFK